MKKVVFNISVDEKTLNEFKHIERIKAFQENRSTNFSELIEEMIKNYIVRNQALVEAHT